MIAHPVDGRIDPNELASLSCATSGAGADDRQSESPSPWLLYVSRCRPSLAEFGGRSCRLVPPAIPLLLSEAFGCGRSVAEGALP